MTAIAPLRWIGSDRRKIAGAAAEMLLREALARRPDDAGLRLRLAGLMFDRSDFAAVATILVPDVAAGALQALELAGRAVLAAGDAGAAIRLLDGPAHAGQVRALSAMAQAMAGREGLVAAMPWVERTLATAPADPIAFNLLAKSLFAAGAPERVDALCKDLQRRGVATAQTSAIRAVARHRMRNEAGANALFDVEAIAVRELDHADNATLAEEILGHANLVPAHPAHATAGGLRVDDPETADSPALLRLVDRVRCAVEAYGAGRIGWNGQMLTGDVRLDIWAVVLSGAAHEEWHVHPSGAVSGVYYVAVPAVGVDAGALQFGLLPFPPEGACPMPALTLTPRPGNLVLFPSSFAHRTLPTHSEEPRISIAFDVVPL